MSSLKKSEGGKLDIKSGKVTPANPNATPAPATQGKIKLFDLKKIPKVVEFEEEKNKAQHPKPGAKR